MGWDSEYLHYTNADNPYGDNNLLDTFVWQQKLQVEGLADLPKYVVFTILCNIKCYVTYLLCVKREFDKIIWLWWMLSFNPTSFIFFFPFTVARPEC